MKFITVYTVLTLCLAQCSLYAQSIQDSLTYPQVGKPCPALTINDVKYFNKSRVSINEFKGKWLVLDFWGLGCSSCIAAFPTINKEKVEFKNDIQFLLICGANEPANFRLIEAQKLYDRIRKKENLNLPCAFDSLIFNRLDIYAVPYNIIIDPKGIVRAITGIPSHDDLSKLIKNENPDLPKAYRKHESKLVLPYNFKLPLLTYNNGGNDTGFLYRSLLSNYKSELPLVVPDEVSAKNGLFEVLGVNLTDMYNYAYWGHNNYSNEFSIDDTAYYGKFLKQPILKIKDTSLFKQSPGGRSDAKNAFCYSLKADPKKGSKANLMKIMQSDLKNYFGYNVAIESRQMPVWKLIVIDRNKFEKNKNHLPIYYQTLAGPGFKNNYASIQELLQQIAASYMVNLYPLMNYTAYNGSFSLTFKEGWDNRADLINALHDSGLDLSEGVNEMKVLVISNP